MATIIVDQAKYYKRTNCNPPKGVYQARYSFLVGGELREVGGFYYEQAVNVVKRLYARPAGVFTIVLEDVRAIDG